MAKRSATLNTAQERRERIASDLHAFLEAQNVIEWLRDNGDLPATVDVETLAYMYAIRYSSQRDLLDQLLAGTVSPRVHELRFNACTCGKWKGTGTTAEVEYLFGLHIKEVLNS